VTVKVAFSTVVGVPLSRPVAFNVVPAGILPDVTAKV
jgi:hypothetical protein